jgi:hypothetical protein
MLNFIGTGSALNPALGNNGAFIKSDNGKTLFMIDCGELTYERLIRFGVLEGVEEIHILITHFHSDHVGSLGTLVADMYYVKQPFEPRVLIYTPRPTDLYGFFNACYVNPRFYNEIRLDGDWINNLHKIGDIGRLMIIPIWVPHVHPEMHMHCFAYYLQFIDSTSSELIYYSGDSRIIPERVLKDFKDGDIDILYQDTSTLDYEDNVHLSLQKLNELIPHDHELRSKVRCMHLDKQHSKVLYEAVGFKIVENFFQ